MSDNTHPPRQNEVSIYLAEDLRNTSRNKAEFVGSVPQSEMEKEGRFILRPFNGVDRTILNSFNDYSRFHEFWAERPARGVYILGTDRENIVSGKTPFIDDVPSLQMFHLKSDGVRYIDLDNLSQSNKESAIDTMAPRLIFKVLRGSKMIVHKDGTGRFASTGDLVNVEVQLDGTPHTLSTLYLFCNSSVASYYMQQIVYSGSTETSRNLDAPYIKNLPIPQISTEEATTLNRLVDYTMFVQQYLSDVDKPSKEEELAQMGTEYKRIAELTASNIYLDVVDTIDLLDALETAIQDEIEFEKWADSRFSTCEYPEETTKNYLENVKTAHKALTKTPLPDLIDEIENSDPYQRVSTVLNS